MLPLHKLRKFFAALSFGLVLLSLPVLGYAQPTDTITPKDLDNKAEVIKIKQDSQDTLNTSVTELEKENSQLEKDILTLTTESTGIESESKKNEIVIDTLAQITNKTPKQVDEIETLTLKNIELKTLKGKISLEQTQKQTKIDSNKKSISDIKDRLANNQNELAKDINSFQGDIFKFVLSISKYILLIVFYWVIVQSIRWLNNKIIPNETIKNVIALVLTFLAIFATFITIFVAFAGILRSIGCSFARLYR
jgi:uncharacterized membrane protein (DUF485 family)